MPVEPLPAATLMLLRDGPVSPETLMIERHSNADFLPDLYVFPGGRVEEQDLRLADRVTSMAPEDARRLESNAPTASGAGFVVAAIRETFEEVGILLARRRGEAGLLDGEETRRLARHRLELQDGRQSFVELVERHDLELAVDRLALHGRWITPEAMPRRFDTLFFTAVAPPGQLAHHDGVETTDHLWIRPAEALTQMRAGKRRIILPTAMNLETLLGLESAFSVLGESRRRPIVPVTPAVVQRAGRSRLVIPPEAGYPLHDSPPSER